MVRRSKTPELDQALDFLYRRINYEQVGKSQTHYPFRLGRMRRLVDALGLGHWLAPTGSNPSGSKTSGSSSSRSDPSGPESSRSNASGPRRPWVVHIAGTKGKGSVATMVQSLLSQCGFRTGLYTSPHLHRLHDRFRIDGVSATDDELIELTERLRECLRNDASLVESTFFELTTAAALDHFARKRCDMVVCEVGLGGRLDSTNVIQSDICVITTLGLDHQHVLGDDLESIAAEKAGILKPNVPVVSSTIDAGPRRVIAETARRVGCPALFLHDAFSCDWIPDADWGSQVTVCWGDHARWSFRLPLEGRHQAENAAVALLAVQYGFRIMTHTRVDERKKNDAWIAFGKPATVQSAFDSALPEARLERYRAGGRQKVVIDAAHNPDSIAAMIDCLNRRAADHHKTVVFGTSQDKDAAAMLGQLAAFADHLVLTQYRGNPRFTPVETLALDVDKHPNLKVTRCADAGEAMETAIQQTPNDGWVVVCGSFFLAAELRNHPLLGHEKC
ncbi:MAG: cyanophycin synthetase [Planctomycetota bacterium]